MIDQTRRLTAEQLEYTATEFGLAANGAQTALKDTESYLRVMDMLRQAARDARTLEGLRAWLKTNEGRIFRHQHKDDGVAYTPFREVIGTLDRLERQP